VALPTCRDKPVRITIPILSGCGAGLSHRDSFGRKQHGCLYLYLRCCHDFIGTELLSFDNTKLEKRFGCLLLQSNRYIGNSLLKISFGQVVMTKSSLCERTFYSKLISWNNYIRLTFYLLKRLVGIFTYTFSTLLIQLSQ